MAYNIFLSYRRKGGYETAKHLYDLLSRDGYNVSFDIDTLRSGDFDTELLKRIEECTDFVLVLNKGAFDRSLDPTVAPKEDWLRNELAYAIKKKKNIIPVMLDGFTEYPKNLPADIAAVVKQECPKYNQYYFNDFYKLLKTKFLKTPAPKKSRKGIIASSILGLLAVCFLTVFFLKGNNKPNAPENLLQIVEMYTSIDFLKEHFGEPKISERKLPDRTPREGYYVSNLTEKKYTWTFNNLELCFYETRGKSLQTYSPLDIEPSEDTYYGGRIYFNLIGEADLLWNEATPISEPNFGVATLGDYLSDAQYYQEYPNKWGWTTFWRTYIWINQNKTDDNSVMIIQTGGVHGTNLVYDYAFSSNENIMDKLSETTKAKLAKKKNNRTNHIFTQNEVQEIFKIIETLKITSYAVGGIDDFDLSGYQIILCDK